MPDGNLTIIIQGKKRFKIKKIISDTPYLKSEIEKISDEKFNHKNKEFKAIIDSIKDLALQIIQENQSIPL